MEFAEVYFPNNFNDFSEGNPGMMFLEMAAYVGDVLSFYTDTQVQETFIDNTTCDKNIFPATPRTILLKSIPFYVKHLRFL